MMFFFAIQTDPVVVGFTYAENHVQAHKVLYEKYEHENPTRIEVYSFDQAFLQMARGNLKGTQAEFEDWVDKNLCIRPETYDKIERMKLKLRKEVVGYDSGSGLLFLTLDHAKKYGYNPGDLSEEEANYFVVKQDGLFIGENGLVDDLKLAKRFTERPDNCEVFGVKK